jgi:hypothetical protein
LKQFFKVSSFKSASEDVVWRTSHLPKDYIFYMRSTPIDDVSTLIFDKLLILIPFYIVWSKGCKVKGFLSALSLVLDFSYKNVDFPKVDRADEGAIVAY